jgi:transcription elongation GreA/GreB family factor
MMISGFPSPFMSATLNASKLIETSVFGNEADTIFVKNVVGAGAGVDVDEELKVGTCTIVVSEDEEPPPHPLSVNAPAAAAIIKIDLFI